MSGRGGGAPAGFDRRSRYRSRVGDRVRIGAVGPPRPSDRRSHGGRSGERPSRNAPAGGRRPGATRDAERPAELRPP
ncbi:hypothetical protein PSMK_30030 [Phycisphaera mikurensis NBRC 102666]|uniref:Uncharacterized protein n=1 Tax=Phycisphaera mikurensis (strain NBRC 102666 / KCTC 22515 / FYK2301M01) TaxID=1142394 RepID=I0IIS4_PHYMF|nr:hypothetical protein PSMK_30030 [Phycisphaera mikurensis NBRC 102666]